MKKTILSYILMLLGYSVLGQIHSNRLALSADIGSMPMVNVKYALNAKSNLKLGVGYFKFKLTQKNAYIDVKDKNLDITVRFQESIVQMAYERYLSNRIYLFGGIAYQPKMTLGIDFGFNKPYTIGNRTYTAEEMGVLSSEITHKNTIMPVAGLGINKIPMSERLHLGFDFGVYYMGKSNTGTLTGTNNVVVYPEFQVKFSDNLLNSKWYPLFNVVFTYKR